MAQQTPTLLLKETFPPRCNFLSEEPSISYRLLCSRARLYINETSEPAHPKKSLSEKNLLIFIKFLVQGYMGKFPKSGEITEWMVIARG